MGSDESIRPRDEDFLACQIHLHLLSANNHCTALLTSCPPFSLGALDDSSVAAWRIAVAPPAGFPADGLEPCCTKWLAYALKHFDSEGPRVPLVPSPNNKRIVSHPLIAQLPVDLGHHSPSALRIMSEDRLPRLILTLNTCVTLDLAFGSTSRHNGVVACHLLRDHANVRVTGSNCLLGRIT